MRPTIKLESAASHFEKALLRPDDPVPIENYQRNVAASELPRLRILMLADTHHHNGNVTDDIYQFQKFSKHKYYLLNPMDARLKNRHTIKRKLLDIIPFDLFDVIFIHFSIYSISESYLSPRIGRKIREFRGLKIQTIRDEFRYVDRFAEKMAYHGIDALFSVLRPEHIKEVYHHPFLERMIKVATLPGLAPGHMMRRAVPPIHERPVDVSYRSNDYADLPPLIGSFGFKKVQFGRDFADHAQRHGLNIDIRFGESNRTYGEDWINLHLQSRAVLSAPGGTSIFDFTGAAAEAVDRYMEENPSSSPNEVIEKALKPFDNNIVHSQITPRTFEAIALRTALVMPRDDYRGVLTPWRHYIPVDDAFSNVDQVVEHLRNDKFLQEMVDRTYQEILVDGGYTREKFVAKFDRSLDAILPMVALNRPVRISALRAFGRQTHNTQVTL